MCTFRKIRKMFDKGNVQVFGLRGSGKDMLMSNVAVRQKNGRTRGVYISNVDYGKNFIDLCLPKFFIGNDYKNFINGNISQYVYPYPDGTDIYISDAGVYFPSHFNSQLNRDYLDFINFIALSRQLGNCNVHVNAQSINRVWDKIREQGDQYILCLGCKVLFKKLVFMKVRVYEKYESAVNKVPPYRLKMPIFASGEARANYIIDKERYYCANGSIKTYFLFFVNKSTYDTRRFKSILEKGETYYENRK